MIKGKPAEKPVFTIFLIGNGIRLMDTQEKSQVETWQMPDQAYGLSEQEAKCRAEAGFSNADAEVKAKSISAIISENVFTLFNLLNFVLGFIVLLAGAYQNALFLIVVLFNLSIGIVNQIRSKKAVEKLSLLSKVKVSVLRDGRVVSVDFSEVVLHDILLLEAGSQIPADCRVIQGNCEVDETLLTGEADSVYKKIGDTLFSGSYVISGKCRAMAIQVGKESYAAKVVNDSRKMGKVNSKILNSLNGVIKFLTVFIVIIGGMLFAKEYFWLKEGGKDALLSTTAAVIGMIPEGMILLTNVALAMGVMKLAQQNTLVQEMYSIETLARVDMLCIDKTGTITDGSICLSEIIPFSYDVQEIRSLLGKTMAAIGDENATAQAIRREIAVPEKVPACIGKSNFSPIRKWSAATFAEEGTYVLGAPEVLKADCGLSDEHNAHIAQLQEQGKRVLVFAKGIQPLVQDEEKGFSYGKEKLEPLAILCFAENIRKEAKEIFSYMRQNGIKVKIISGDSGKTVYAIARAAGAECAGGYIDVFDMDQKALEQAVEHYSVFGRVTPQQKKQIVHYLKTHGKTVAMTGDGVNDVPALKEADCSITLRTGSDAARTISQIVLMDSNLYSIYNTILEGNRVINNIQRSASLFLIKTVFSCLLSLLFMLLPLSYPFFPVQLTLVSSLCIGIPSFLLSFQKSYGHIDEDFFGPVLKNAFPGGLCIVLYVLIFCILGKILHWQEGKIAMLCTMAAGISAFYVLFKVMRPFNLWKGLVYAGLMTAFGVAAILFKDLFFFDRISWEIAAWGIGMLALLWPVNRLFAKVTDWVLEKVRIWRRNKQAGIPDGVSNIN